MEIFGIDVSHWQGNFNFKAAKDEGVKFAILKAGGGDAGLYQDAKFNTYYEQAKALGLGVGAYFFGAAFSVEQAQREADKFIEILRGKQLDYPVYYDVEAKMLKQDKAILTDIVYAFCERVEKAGFYVGIYASESTFKSKFNYDRLARFAGWAAKWSKTRPSGDFGLWQFGGETNKIRSNKVAGVVCDQDFCYVDYPEVIKRLGLNGYMASTPTPAPTPAPTPTPTPTPAPAPTKKSNDEIADEVIAGKWGNGQQRREKLTAAGYNYEEVQSIVNKKTKAYINGGAKYYTVKAGDTLSGIAKKYNTTVAKLVDLNNIKNPNLIIIGQKLRVQ